MFFSVEVFSVLVSVSVFLGVGEGFWVLESVFGCFRVLKCFSVLVSVFSVFGCWRVFLSVEECL